VLEHERSLGDRIVAESEHFVVFCPYASRFPFEMCVVPRAHTSRFSELADEQIPDLAAVLQEAIARLETCLEAPPYNYLVHTGPVGAPEAPGYHWHIELIPRVTRTAGFEWGTGCYINPMEPERAAGYLREVTDAQVADRIGSVPAGERAGR